MEINTPTLRALRTGFSTAFRGQLEQATPMRERIASTVPSTTRSNTYGWMTNMPSMREWIGPRHIAAISARSYELPNIPFEQTIGVDKYDIQDDNLGQYNLLFAEMGEAARAKPEQLVWGGLAGGLATECFDGQFYFDTDHPQIGDDGETVGTYSNFQGGSGTPWYLAYTKRMLKPVIFQERQKPLFVAMDNPDDERVFMQRQFVYGTEARWNVGYSFPQLAYASKETLNAANYKIARAAMGGFTGDGGRPLGIVPDLLIVPASLESEGRKLLNSEYASGGETNEWKGTAELLVCPWLA